MLILDEHCQLHFPDSLLTLTLFHLNFDPFLNLSAKKTEYESFSLKFDELF